MATPAVSVLPFAAGPEAERPESLAFLPPGRSCWLGCVPSLRSAVNPAAIGGGGRQSGCFRRLPRWLRDYWPRRFEDEGTRGGRGLVALRPVRQARASRAGSREAGSVLQETLGLSTI